MSDKPKKSVKEFVELLTDQERLELESLIERSLFIRDELNSDRLTEEDKMKLLKRLNKHE